jgi:hypothetical protein
MKHLNFLLLAIISLILLVSVNAATVSHPASEITAGTFGAGDYTITNTGEVFLSISNTEAGGHDYRLVSAGSVGGIGVGKFSIYDSTAGVDQSRLTIDSSGNVGIGTTTPKTQLDVAGAVRVGSFSSKPSCNSNTIGALVFDTSANKPYVCASGGWKPLDSDFDEDGLIDWLDPNDNSFNSQCSTDNGGQCYLSQGSKTALDSDLAAGNIKSGVNIFGIDGTLYAGIPIDTDGDGVNSIAGADCNDDPSTGRSVWQLLTGFIDGDGDGFGTGTSQQVCSGASLPAPYSSNNDDCYDQNSNAHPGGGAYASHRGDGSFDYNCNGLQETTITRTATYDPATDSCPRSGWWGGVPGCGSTGTWGQSCMVSRPFNVCWCESAVFNRPQLCS